MRFPHPGLLFPLLLTACPLLSSCESVVSGSVLTSAAVSNELVRYTLPELGHIDRIELSEYFYVDHDSRALGYYEALNPKPPAYLSGMDEPVMHWTYPVRSTEMNRPKVPSHQGSSKTFVGSISDPQSVSEFVTVFNDHRSLWLNKFDLVPLNPYAHPHYEISFYWHNELVRSIGFNKSTLSTTHEAKTIIRRLSDADAIAVERLLRRHVQH